MKNINPTFATLPKDSIHESTDKPLFASVGIFMEEIWKDIEGYEGLYQVSNLGKIKSLNRCIIDKNNNLKELKSVQLTQTVNKKNGYYMVSLSKNGTVRKFTSHRLLAIAFIPNPLNLPEVNHVDGIKINTYLSNLEWCTKSENALHCWKMGMNTAANLGMTGSLCPRSKKIRQYTMDMVLLNDFDAIIEAQRNTKISHGNISMCLLGHRKSAGGFIWKYL